jgi:uncharacterized membrane protein YvlD (DUF360 family)
MPSPYHPSASQSRFAFGSRTQPAPAPLFYSARDDDFREEDEREVADIYAVRESRKRFESSRMSESSEVEDEDKSTHTDDDADSAENPMSRPYSSIRRGIRSSWRGDKSRRGRPPAIQESVAETRERSTAESEVSRTRSGKGKEKLVDVDLASSPRPSSEISSVNALESEEEPEDDNPPPFQEFRRPTKAGDDRQHRYMPEETDDETARLNPRPPSADRESVPPGVTGDAIAPPKHDAFWANLYWICFASIFATSFLVYLNTDVPAGKKPLGDTVYTVLQKSYHLLAVDTLVSVIVAAIWLALLRSFLRPLTYLLLVAIPIVLFSFSLYPLIASSKGYWKGESLQDKLMWWFSFMPLAGAIMWCYLTVKARHSIEKAIAILDFACRILASSPALIVVGFGSVALIIFEFWIWLWMFSRVFLEGHWASTSKDLYIIDVSSWWLGVFYILMLLWTQSIISGIQRATSAATTSQWYFHRNTLPAPSSRQVVQASFYHAIGTLFGTICLSTFLSVAIRLPLLLLPRRIVAFFSVCFYNIVPSPIASLTNPLTLTYAAIHSQPLTVSAQGLSNLSFISRTEATTTLSPNSVNATTGDSLVPYRTAKLILHATRYMMTVALGFGGWVSTARMVHLVDGHSGSLYAYIVGLGAAAIGWGILGAMEGIILGILDALVVCWGSEVGAVGDGRVRYCREAGELFGEKDTAWGPLRV